MKHNKSWFMSDLYLGEVNRADLLKCWADCIFDQDNVYLLGNIVAANKSYWFNQIQQLPGKKILFISSLETNRIQWYQKFDFSEIVPFNQVRFMHSPFGKMVLSSLPVYESVLPVQDSKLKGLIQKFNREFNAASGILNIHGYTQGKGIERGNTVDISADILNGNIPTLQQLYEKVKTNEIKI